MGVCDSRVKSHENTAVLNLSEIRLSAEGVQTSKARIGVKGDVTNGWK